MKGGIRLLMEPAVVREIMDMRNILWEETQYMLIAPRMFAGHRF